MCAIIIGIIVIGVVIYVCMKLSEQNAVNRAEIEATQVRLLAERREKELAEQREKDAKIAERKRKYSQYIAEISSCKIAFENVLNNLWVHAEHVGNLASVYQQTDGADVLKKLRGLYNDMEKNLTQLGFYGDAAACASLVGACEKMLKQYEEFFNSQPSSHLSLAMASGSYGKPDEGFFAQIKQINKETVAEKCAAWENASKFEEVREFDFHEILKVMWFYAMEKPFSASNHARVIAIYERISGNSHPDMFVSELYAIQQMSGSGIVRDRVREYLNPSKSSKSGNYLIRLEELASALKWMGAYDAEHDVLEHMLNKGVEMPQKLQERLHSLSNGGGNAPEGHDVASDDDALYFDVASLGWDSAAYDGFFENLSFQEKTLTYSLCVRSEDKELSLTLGKTFPGIEAIVKKIKTGLEEEYGDCASANQVKGVALSGNSQETLSGIRIQSSECKQLGLFLCMVPIGKKLNLKFYTLYMPTQADLLQQKQEALSLQKKMSPSASMWESSLIQAVLTSIEQVLNENVGSIPTSNNGTVGEEIEF